MDVSQQGPGVQGCPKQSSEIYIRTVCFCTGRFPRLSSHWLCVWGLLRIKSLDLNIEMCVRAQGSWEALRCLGELLSWCAARADHSRGWREDCWGGHGHSWGALWSPQRHTGRLGSKVNMCMVQERIFLIFSDKFALMASRDKKDSSLPCYSAADSSLRGLFKVAFTVETGARTLEKQHRRSSNTQMRF